MSASISHECIFVDLKRLGIKEGIMMDEEFINFKSLEKKTKSVIMTCVKEGNNACEATSEVMDLWFPGVVKASDGGTMYNDIDLEVQYILTRNGYPEDDDE